MPIGSHWYVYVLTLLGIAYALQGLASRLAGDTARAYVRAALFVASLAAIAQAARTVAAWGTFPAFIFRGLELWGALACALLSAWFFRAKTRALDDALTAYGVVLLGLLAAHLRPPAAPGNVGLSLALASALMWSVRRQVSALACGWVALAVCGVYILHGGFLGTDSVALLLLAAYPPPCSLRLGPWREKKAWKQGKRVWQARPLPRKRFLLRKAPAKQGGGPTPRGWRWRRRRL